MKKNIAVTNASLAVTASLVAGVWKLPNKLATKGFNKL